MRNKPTVFLRLTPACGALILGLASFPFLSGCLEGGARATLNKGYGQLETKDYDSAQASADEFLRSHPDGTGVGEALYLKGRIEEAEAADPSVSPSAADQRSHLDAARDAYEKGLDTAAPSGVKAQIRTGIANVDFHEEDYANALREWSSAYDSIESDDTKSWVLYHIGRCDQRLGMFDKADEAYSKVQRLFPGSEAAIRAASRMGLNSFYVEVGSFPSTANAETAANELRTQGYPASRTVDMGRQIVRVGPISTYVDAKAFQGRLRRQYPGAIISP